MQRIPRRQLIAYSGAIAVLLMTGFGILRASGYRTDTAVARALKILRPWQYVVIEAVGFRILAPERSSTGLFVDEYCVGLPAEDRTDFLRFLGYVEHVAPLLLGFARRFSSLLPGDQDEVLAALETSSMHDLRAGFQALKALVLMAHYRRPESWRGIGYDGPFAVFG